MKEKKVSFFRWFFVEKDSANVIVYLVLLFSAALSFVVFAASSDEYENILPALFFFGLGLLVLEVICYFTDYWWEP